MALHSLYCADVPLRNCSLTHNAAASFNCRLGCSADLSYMCVTAVFIR